ncbi:hypothetical protein CORC01_06611 [Colletotrichum orchidophilum]|uniref:Nephrocystin 3-like N-terminal domain-containing protein n=1 Tax=Colletotrichum orchidophilum TaxID=1209926 RepID=A0A1G4B9K4_9PEZI|nr:uncharacterized protein CORC01_06611 [Colletotrichum orchidophilum]OHE98097.1 hypothetical protein CORC01_06611 [Colletotrichum orchidophilum]
MSSVKSDVDDEQYKLEDVEDETLKTETADKLETDDVEKPPSEHGDNESVASESQSVERVIEYGLLPENENDGGFQLDVITVHSVSHTSWSVEYITGVWNPNQGPKPSSWWLRNLFSSSRVLHYHYNIDCTDLDVPPDVLTPGGIEREAQKLLDAVTRNWADNPPRKNPRPIVFVGHDVGGTIIKKRINAEFLDTKAFLRAVMINIIGEELKRSPSYTRIILPTPFRVSSCATEVLYEECLVWDTPHPRLINGDNFKACHAEFSNVFGTHIGQHPFTIEPGPQDTPIHKVLIPKSPPTVPWKLDEFTWFAREVNHWIVGHEEYRKWQNSSGLGILHFRCPEGLTRMLSHRFYGRIKNPKESTLFHIFSRRDDRCNSLESLFANLDCQLVGRYPLYYRYSFCWAVLVSQKACTTQDLAQLFSSYSRAVHLKEAIYFVSCLDECDETRYKLVEFLSEIRKHSEQPLRFVVTTTKGRDERLESQLASFPTIDAGEYLARPEEQAAFTKEMKKMVETQIERLLRLRPAFLQFKDRIHEVLATCGQDLQLACFVTRWLAENTSIHNNRSFVRRILDRLTPLTTETFITAILESFGDRAARVRKMIFWIKLAFEKPTLREVGEALYISADMKDPDVEGLEDIDYDELSNDILQFGGLITFDGHEVDLFRPESFPSNDAAIAHAEMASICLDYLVLPEVWENLEDMIEKNALLDEAPVSRPRHNLVSYAAKYWTKHYKLAGEHRPKAQALKLFEYPKARNLWAQAVYVLSDPLSRIPKGYISALPVVSSTGMGEFVNHQLEAERISPDFNADSFPVDVGLSIVEAARGGHEEVVQLLLKASVPKNGLLSEALVVAAASGSETTLNHLVGVAAKIKEFEWPQELFRRVAWLGLMKTAKLLLASDVPLPPFECDGLETSLVHMALEGNHPEVAKLLIDANADLEATANDGQRPIHFAVYQGEVDVIQSLLAAGVDANALDTRGNSPLQLAAFGANPQAIKVLLEAGADANIGQDTSWVGNLEWSWDARPLLYAIISGYTECARVLLEHDVDVNVKLDGKNALWYAASRGDIELCRQLLEHRANPNETTKNSEPLLIAAVSFSIPPGKIIELLELFIEYKVDLEVRDESQTWRNNVLSRAVGTDNKDLVEFLLEHGLPTNMGAETSQTPLYVAAYVRNADFVRLLLDHEADPNLKSEWDWTPLHAAYDNAEITELLLKAGADVDAVCDSGTAAYLAAKHNRMDVLQLLLDHTTKPNLEIETPVLSDGAQSGVGRPDPEERGMTPLCIACQKGSADCIELLLGAGAEVNHRTKDGSFPLMFCIRSTSTWLAVSSIELLLKHESEPNLKLTDNNGNTILHNLGTHTDDRTMELLFRLGAEVDVKNLQGETPLLIAVLCENIDAFKALRRRGADVKVCSPTKGTLLHVAARTGRWDLFEEVQAAGCDVGVARSLGFKETLLYSLASSNSNGPDQRQIAEYLIQEAKEDPDEESPRTAFGFPILAGLLSPAKVVTDYLIEKGAKLNVKDAMGRTPLHIAAMEYPGDGTVETLLRKGADVTAPTKVGLLPVHFAAAHPWSSTPLVQLLRHIEGPGSDLDGAKHGEDDTESVGHRSDDRDETRVTPFERREPPAQTTARDGEGTSDEKLKNEKPPFDIEAKDKDGWTPLMWSAKGNYNNFDVPKALLERGASLWTMAEGPAQRWSPLKISRYYGATDDMIELLTPKEKTRTLPDGTTEEWRDQDHKERAGNYQPAWNCGHCLMAILGKRYRCHECEADSFNMCYKCVASKDVLHPNHEFEALGPEYEVGAGDSTEEQKPDDAGNKDQLDETGEGDDDDEVSDIEDDNEIDSDSDDD